MWNLAIHQWIEPVNEDFDNDKLRNGADTEAGDDKMSWDLASGHVIANQKAEEAKAEILISYSAGWTKKRPPNHTGRQKSQEKTEPTGSRSPTGGLQIPSDCGG